MKTTHFGLNLAATSRLGRTTTGGQSSTKTNSFNQTAAPVKTAGGNSSVWKKIAGGIAASFLKIGRFFETALKSALPDLMQAHSAQAEFNQAINSAIDARNITSGDAGLGIYVNGQGREPYKEYRFNHGNFGDNGCMAISMYNSMVSLGQYKPLSDIEYYANMTNGTIMGGVKGGNPVTVEDYFTAQGYEVTKTYFPSQSELETAVQQGDTNILLYGWRRGRDKGVHFVTIDYDENQKMPYRIYNEYNSSQNVSEKTDLSAVTGTGHMPLVVYSINKL